jgi:hypothetical protein
MDGLSTKYGAVEGQVYIVHGIYKSCILHRSLTPQIFSAPQQTAIALVWLKSQHGTNISVINDSTLEKQQHGSVSCYHVVMYWHGHQHECDIISLSFSYKVGWNNLQTITGKVIWYIGRPGISCAYVAVKGWRYVFSILFLLEYPVKFLVGTNYRQ